MKIKDIEIDKSYRHKDHDSYCWAKVLEILKPKQGENNTSRTVVKCKWSVQKDSEAGIIKYFNATV